MRKSVHTAVAVLAMSIFGAAAVTVPMTWFDLIASNRQSSITPLCTSCHGRSTSSSAVPR